MSAIACGAVAALFARKRGRSPYKWFFLGFFFGLLGLFAAVFFLPSASKRTVSPIQKPEPRILGPTHKFWYYLDANHQQVGPVSYNALSDFFKKGTVSSATYVWNEEMDDWKYLKEFIGV